jgi:AcrR family transcriptional regulator
MVTVNDPPSDRRSRRKRATSEAIVAAALDLFVTHGFGAVTINQIADRADVAPRTVYRYFPNKAAIVFDVQTQWMAVLRSAAGEVMPDESVFERLRRVASTIAEFAMVAPEQALIGFDLISDSTELQAVSLGWERDWRIAVATLVSEFGPTGSVVFAGLVMGMISANVELWLSGGAVDNLAAMIDAGIDAIEHGWGAVTS